jgi:hypothetical protein
MFPSTILAHNSASSSPHDPIAAMVLGLLELVFYGDDLNLKTGTLQVLADGADMRRPLAVKAQERENTDLSGHSEQLLECGDVEVQDKLLRAEDRKWETRANENWPSENPDDRDTNALCTGVNTSGRVSYRLCDRATNALRTRVKTEHSRTGSLTLRSNEQGGASPPPRRRFQAPA